VTAGAFEHHLRVYWEDTDAGGVVFYANYLKFFERARTEWLRTLGFGQEALRRERGLMFVVAETAVRYLEPARLDDVLTVSAELVVRGRASLEIAQQAQRIEPGPPRRLAEGRIRIGCVEAGSFRPARIPSDLLERLA
jgi:acyl-CoA thioester hydrolase